MKSNDRYAIDTSCARAVACLILACCLADAADAQTKYSANHASVSGSTPMTYMGFTEPEHDIMVAADELGRLESIEVEIGDSVAEGQVLGNLEDSLQEVSVELARLQLQMTGEFEATKAEVELNRSRTIQLRRLVEDQMARPDELIRAETDLRITQAKHAAVIEQTELRKVELRRYEMQLERRKVRAPMSGVIADIFRHPGEYITPADPAIVRLMVIDKLLAVFNVPVEDTIAIHVGDVARVFLIGREQTVTATVTTIAPNIDAESGTVQVRVKLDNPDGKLLSGDQCTLQILYGQSLDPQQATVPSPARDIQEQTTTR